jgi:hypothetical protein
MTADIPSIESQLANLREQLAKHQPEVREQVSASAGGAR